MAVAQPEGITTNLKHPQVCRKWSLAICSQVPAPLSRSPPHAWLVVAMVPHLTLFCCGSCTPSPARAVAMTYPAMPLVLPPSRVGGLTGNSPKLILLWVVVYFSGHWGGWWAGLGGASWGHAACRDVHTPAVHRHWDSGEAPWARSQGICSLRLSTKPDCGLRGDFSVPVLPSI